MLLLSLLYFASYTLIRIPRSRLLRITKFKRHLVNQHTLLQIKHIFQSIFRQFPFNWKKTLSYLISFEVSRHGSPYQIDWVRILLFLGQQPFGKLDTFGTSANLNEKNKKEIKHLHKLFDNKCHSTALKAKLCYNKTAALMSKLIQFLSQKRRFHYINVHSYNGITTRNEQILMFPWSLL